MCTATGKMELLVWYINVGVLSALHEDFARLDFGRYLSISFSCRPGELCGTDSLHFGINQLTEPCTRISAQGLPAMIRLVCHSTVIDSLEDANPSLEGM